MEQKRREDLIPVIEDALLRTSCSRDEHGNIVYDIYADYRSASLLHNKRSVA